MDEGTCLENRHTLTAYRGFESHPLRQTSFFLSLLGEGCDCLG